jgi:putative membrane protein
MLVLGIVYQLQFMRGLRHLRADMKSEGLVYGETHFPPSMTLLVALGLLAIGILAMLSIQLHVGPFD